MTRGRRKTRFGAIATLGMLMSFILGASFVNASAENVTADVLACINKNTGSVRISKICTPRETRFQWLINGLTGKQGVRGSQILTGHSSSDLNARSFGDVGDYFLSSADATLYGPKTDSGWPSVGIKIQGPIGPQGIQGLPGVNGAAGPKGDPGVNGIAGPQGIQGLPGVKGEVGATGSIGATGLDGSIGPAGVKGDTGATGAQGVQGDKGEVGAIGPIGPRGLGYPDLVPSFTSATAAAQIVNMGTYLTCIGPNWVDINSPQYVYCDRTFQVNEKVIFANFAPADITAGYAEFSIWLNRPCKIGFNWDPDVFIRVTSTTPEFYLSEGTTSACIRATVRTTSSTIKYYYQNG